MHLKHMALFIFIVLLISFSPMTSVKAEINQAKNGLFSVPPIHGEDILPLDGEWEFYWEELYTPQDFKTDHVSKIPTIVDVPNTWSNYQLENENLPKTGYATFRLLIEVPDHALGTMKSLYVPSISSAYKMWVNGNELSSNGNVGNSRDTMEPESSPKVVQFIVDTNPIEVVIQASNFNQRKAGIYDSIYIGEPDHITTYREQKIIYRMLIVVSIVVMGLYHLVMYAFRPKDVSHIYFGILCILVGLRSTILEEGLASYLLFFLHWEVMTKIEYLGASLGTLFITLFMYTQFTEDMNKKVCNIFVVVQSLYSLFVLFTPAILYTQTMVLMQIWIIITFVYLIYVCMIAFFRKRADSLLNVIAIILFFVTVINDILYYNLILDTMELVSFGLFLFLFVQSVILSKRYSFVFIRTENLSEDLARLNESLEHQVLERTEELRYANKELEIVNEKLKEAHQMRSKWIRNISHDLGTPLTSIRAYTKGMLDGIVQSDEKYIRLIYEQSLYISKMLNDLFEMSEKGTNEITFNQEKISIKDYIRNLYEKYQIEMEKQGTQVNYRERSTVQPGNLYVLIDTLRIEQVFVNLITNAQRFIKEDGKITVELDQPDDHHITIKIIDNGIGVNKEEINLLFNRFYKSDKQGKMHNGSGLGLAICKEIIELQGGEIGVESKEGKGSCFYFTLPLVYV